ncbi:MAG TPA: TlpA disulfide reductase family protein [Acetobacteraceae bacterium]|nr:TlpA disulfide reductase family protein [Acetobacteraceae bacterium]
MVLITRRHLLTAGGTLASGLVARKPLVAEPHDLATELVPTDPPVPAPDIAFLAADGSEHHLRDFIGHGMVINLWATWCVPCVEEMPSLAVLSKALAPDDIAVLPLSSDRGGVRAVEAFYQEHNITGLPVLLDPKGAAAHAWHARGIPTSVIIDKQGRERARLEGSADWSTPPAVAIVRKLVAG